MTPDLVVVACGAAKQEGRHRARELYIGSYFRAAMNLADALSKPTLIISAKYGLVRTTDLIDSYDVKMGDDGCVQLPTVLRQADLLRLLNRERVIVLGGMRYVEFCRNVWPVVWNPAAGPRQGIGRQMATFKRMALQLAERSEEYEL